MLPFETMRYEYAVHELPAELADRSQPERRPVRLLVYRDDTRVVRYLELSEFASELVAKLSGQLSVEVALRVLLDRPEGSLPNEDLARAGRLIADLAQRGIIR